MINAFPQKAEENTEQLVVDLADEMGISIRLLKLLKASHRLSKRGKAGGAIIVTLKSRKLRNKFYEPRKQRVGLNSLSVLCALHVYHSKSLNHNKHVGLTKANFSFENASIGMIHTRVS